MVNGWSNWINISDGLDQEIIGVYKIRIVDSNGNPFEINRFLGKDSKGILSIGQSTKLKDRMKQFYSCINDNTTGHSGGMRFYIITKVTEFENKFQNFTIQFSTLKLNSEDEAKIVEEKLIKCYFKKFGELPPLNSNLPGQSEDRKYDENKWDLDC